MGIFSDDGDDGHTCPTRDLSEQAQDPAIGNMSFQTFNMIISGAAAAFAMLVVLFFKFMHATHFSNPKQQGNIMRVSLLIPMYVLISWISIASPTAYPYINPWIHVVEAWSLCSFFLLLCEYMAPTQRERDAFLATKYIPNKKGAVQGHKWFEARWILVFQYPVVSFLVAIFTAITEGAGVYCMFSGSFRFAKFWLHLFSIISLVLAMVTMLKIFKHLKPELAVHNAMMKFIAFKLVIFLTLVQSIVLWILEDHTSIMDPSSTMTWVDLHIGIPNMLPCLEMVPLSLFFVYAYPWAPYSKGRADTDESRNDVVQYQGGFLGWRAFFEMFNPSELIHGIIFAFKLLRRRGD